MTHEQFKLLRYFRGTGRYVGKDATWKHKHSTVDWRRLEELRRLGLLDIVYAQNYYLTDAGRAFLRNPMDFALEV